MIADGRSLSALFVWKEEMMGQSETMTGPSDQDLEKIRTLRHWLHAHPEVSREEWKTADHIRAFLSDAASPDAIIDLDGAGFAAIYEGAQDGKTILLRTELDALPIAEVNAELAYRSINEGIAHSCGHDGHMAMLAGVALALAKSRPAKGRVVILFQPDEETGTGAKGCVQHPNFAAIKPDFSFSLHNLPGYPMGEIVCRTGTFASAVHYEAIRFVGKPAHSAQPETGVSPAQAIADLIASANDIAAMVDGQSDYALIVPIYTHMGVASSGVAPAKGEVHFTLRSDADAVVATMLDVIKEKAQKQAEHLGLDVSFETLEKFDASVNGQQAVAMIERSAKRLNKPYQAADTAFRWGEDFGAVTAVSEGAMFGLGSGLETPPLHDEAYNFPDAVLSEGISMFLDLLEQASDA
jgi:amidohydrolase